MVVVLIMKLDYLLHIYASLRYVTFIPINEGQQTSVVLHLDPKSES